MEQRDCRAKDSEFDRQYGWERSQKVWQDDEEHMGQQRCEPRHDQ
jgi:hypothetical protein